MAAAPPILPPLACGGSTERRPKGHAGRGSSLLATPTRLRMVALHSSSFSVTGGKSRSNCARAPKLLLAWVAVKAAWTVMRSDF